MKNQKPANPASSGGSTLKRLKSTLKTAGLIGPKAKSSAGKQGGTSTLKSRTDALLKSLRSNNPFEQQHTREKHQVLGRKVKGAQGRPGLTRQKGLDQRKDALMGELARRGKVGGVVDRRIGGRGGMTDEEIAIARWTKEKQRQSSKTMYNLDSAASESGLSGLTHLGRPIDEMESFDDLVGSDDEGMDPALARQMALAQFGGGAGDHGHKSKADVMKELIAKAKAHKAERARVKEEVENLRVDLDDDFDSIRGLLVDKKAARTAEPPTNGTAAPAAAAAADVKKPDANDDFESLVRSLRFDKRAQPADRTKTAEEVAATEAARLARLERDRMRRMNGELASDDEDADAAEFGTGNDRELLPAGAKSGGSEGGYRAKRERRKREMRKAEALAGGDADGAGDADFGSDAELDGNMERVDLFGNSRGGESALTYSMDGGAVVSGKLVVRKRGAAEVSDDEDDSDDDDEVEEDSDADDSEEEEDVDADLQVSDGSDLEDDDDDNDSGDDEDNSDADLEISSDEEAAMKALAASRPRRPVCPTMSEDQRTAMMLTAQRELPYTFPAPTSVADFASLVEGRGPTDIAELVSRFRAQYHPALAQGNKEKHARFVPVLMEWLWSPTLGAHAHVVVTTTTSLDNGDVQDQEETMLDVVEAADKLYPHVRDLTAAYPLVFAQWSSDALGGLLAKDGPTAAGPSDWTAAQLLVVRILGHLWSVTDYHHAIITPLVVAIACYLSKPAKSMRDAATGIWLCGWLLETQRETKRWIPEVFNYLARLLAAYSPARHSTTIAGFFPTQDLLPPAPLKAAPRALPFAASASGGRNGVSASSLVSAVCAMQRALDATYAGTIDSLPELYAPLLPLIDAFATPTNEKEVHEAVRGTAEALATAWRATAARTTQHRRVLAMQRHRPLALASAEPQFDDYYSLDRKLNEAGVDVETQKLKAEYKKEKKGAIRELRRDAEFLARVRNDEQRKKDKEYATKMRRIEGTLGDEVGEMKRFKRDAAKRRKL